MGLKLDILNDGLTVVEVKDESPASNTGIKVGDLIVEVNGMPTRYLPLNEVIKMIEVKDEDPVLFTLQRDLTVWRK